MAQKLYDNPEEYAEGWNFGPNDDNIKSVDWILDRMVIQLPNSSWNLDEDSHPHEAGFLKLDITKAKLKLKWKPTWALDYTLEKITNWHKSWLNEEDMQAVCLNEINEYMRDMNHENN